MVFFIFYIPDLLVYVPNLLVGDSIWAYLIGGAFILAGFSFMTNQFVKLSSYLLVILLIFFVTIHWPDYQNTGDKEMRQMTLINILKDTAIVGFALHIGAGAHHQHFHLEDSD